MPKLGTTPIEVQGEMMHSIFRIDGTTKFRAKDTRDLDGNPGAEIPKHPLKFSPHEALAEGLLASVAVAAGIHPDKFSLNSFVFLGVDRFCYPVVEVKCEVPVAIELIHSVISKLLKQVKRQKPENPSFFSSDIVDLGEQAEAEIKAGATAILTRYGDCPISTPSKIYVGGDAMSAEFQGMFASKPDLSDLKPVPLEFEGRVDGYRAKKREIFVDTNEGSLIVHWEKDDQVVGNLSLGQKADILVFQVDRTIDQRGNPINTLVSISKK